MIKLALIGVGYWGPNYLRNFSQLDGCKVTAVADMSKDRLAKVQKDYPDIHGYASVDEMFTKEPTDAVVIATPTSTHFAVTTAALKSGRHVLVEKPLAMTEKECVELTALADKQKKLLMVGHTFLYNSALSWLRDYIKQGKLGKTYYIYAVRTNLGPIREDVNAMIDLAPHDISTFLFLMDEPPTAVSAQGASFVKPGREDVTFLTLYFKSGAIGHIHVSWLDPRKVRQTTVIGDKQMVVFNDINSFEPIRIFNKSVTKEHSVTDFTQFKAILHEGDVVIPKIPLSEPLKTQCKEFLDCIAQDRKPLSDGRLGATVVKVLEGATRSLKEKGQIVPLA